MEILNYILGGLYTGATIEGFLNQQVRDIKNMALPKRLTLLSSFALGIDSLIIPMISNGQSLHELVGVSFGDYETLVKSSEMVLAYAGTIYQNVQNWKYILKNRDKK